MGDAGLPTSSVVLDPRGEVGLVRRASQETIREINVLVTGYGPFKSVETNPSYQITQNLPALLDPTAYRDLLLKHLSSSQRLPIRQSNTQPYIIRLHTYPTPLRVAYGAVAPLVPSLIAWSKDGSPNPLSESEIKSASQTDSGASINYDYVLHIGMAGGRGHYSLETQAHRDNFKIKDVDDRDGFISGEYNWKRENLPEKLQVGWDKDEVLARWEDMTIQAELDHEQAALEASIAGHLAGKEKDDCQSVRKPDKSHHAIVKLSHDAGRYLCEFVLYASLSTRWREARDAHSQDTDQDTVTNQDVICTTTINSSGDYRNTVHFSSESPQDRIGKIAFLHVPGGIQEHEIARGTRVTEAAILAIVSSWEDGYRNKEVYGRWPVLVA